MNFNILKGYIPPILWDILYRSPFKRYGWFDDFKSWQEALDQSSGYDSSEILKKVSASTQRVLKKEAEFERDSVLFDRIQYDWPVLAALMWISAQNNGKLNVIDFGGSLGSSYWQNRKFLNSIPEVKWSIIEQKEFVDYGRKNLSDHNLRFYNNLEECLLENSPHVVLLSNVLSYLQNPFDLLQNLVDQKFQYIIIDKMPLIEGEKDRLTIQKVPPRIYKASYPCWFFSKRKFENFIKVNYLIIEEFETPVRTNVVSEVKGFILKNKGLTKVHDL